jgi:hypothetical protein
MKKLFFTLLLLIIFNLSFSDGINEGQAKMIESQFAYKYSNPTIGDTTLKNIEYELEFYTNTALLEVEIETFHGDGGWSKLKKEEIDKFLKKLADEIREEINQPDLPVNILVTLEADITFQEDEEVLLNKLY